MLIWLLQINVILSKIGLQMDVHCILILVDSLVGNVNLVPSLIQCLLAPIVSNLFAQMFNAQLRFDIPKNVS